MHYAFVLVHRYRSIANIVLGNDQRQPHFKIDRSLKIKAIRQSRKCHDEWRLIIEEVIYVWMV